MSDNEEQADLRGSPVSEVAVPPAITRRRAATVHKQTTLCETGLPKSILAELLTSEVPTRMQTNELGDFDESSSAPQASMESKVSSVQVNSSGASRAMQGQAKVSDSCQIKMEADTLHNVKRENTFSANVCLVLSPYGCNICSRSFEEADALFSHVMTCPSPEPLRCALCPELCADWGTARNHVVSHIQKRTPKCPMCGYAFGKQWTVERHVQMRHLPIRPFVCNCCGNTFSGKSDVYKHSLQCRAKSQEIEQYLASRKKSDTRVHGPVPNTVYKCSVCARAFLDRLVMARHMRVHVNQVQQSRADEVKKDPFDCGNHKSFGIGPPKVKNGVKVYTQCFIRIPVADKTTGCKVFSKAIQADLKSSAVSSWTQCDDVEDSEEAF